MKKHVLLIVIAVMLIGSLLVGTSYALWTKSHVQDSDNIVEAGCFATEITEANVLNISNDYPISDDKGKTRTPYQITITNTCSVDAGYTALIEVLSDSNMNSKYLKVQIDNNDPKALNTYENNGTPLISGAKESYVFATGWLKEGESVTYSIRYWIDESATLETVGGTSMKTRVVISSVAGVVPKAPTAVEVVSNLLNTTPNQVVADDPDGNVRFYGKSPNNYVDFNGEKWRIIGVFDIINPNTGVVEKKAKIVRDESIGSYSWDSSVSEVNGGYGVNEWSQADIMTTLNGGAYWNRAESGGECYVAENLYTTSCTFEGNGLTTESKKLIDRVRWNTGTNSKKLDDTYKVSSWYNDERSNNTGKICLDGERCNDAVTRTTTWDGFVGLMYPSDYIYATGGGDLKNRELCLNSFNEEWGLDKALSYCATDNWLLKEGDFQLTLTPASNSSSNDGIFVLTPVAVVAANSAAWGGAVHPAVYLKSDVVITGGDGTIDNSYKLSAGSKDIFDPNSDNAVAVVENLLNTAPDQLIADDPDGNVRFYGENPNNYVLFNEDYWRIVGSFQVLNPDTGVFEKRLKLVSSSSYKTMAWDSNNSNEWTTSSLGIELNNRFYNNFTMESLELIDKTRWYLGGTTKYEQSYNGLIKHFYGHEKSSVVYNGHSLTYDGYFGLLYPSDYGYATGSDRSFCLSNQLVNWWEDKCVINNWLFMNGNYWTLTPYANQDSVFIIDNNGSLSYSSVTDNSTYEVYPTFYLKSDVRVISGDGTIYNPYQLSL